jgi:hypothetical protein
MPVVLTTGTLTRRRTTHHYGGITGSLEPLGQIFPLNALNRREGSEAAVLRSFLDRSFLDRWGDWGLSPVIRWLLLSG